MFLGGLVLLFSGATRSLAGRLAWLNSLLPLPIIEASHFLASAIGILMLFVARGLWRRLDAAWLFASVLLAAGIVLSLLKGLDWEEALALALMLALLLPCRRFFFRRSSLLDGGLSVPWAASIVVAIIASAWLARYTYRHAEYSASCGGNSCSTATPPIAAGACRRWSRGGRHRVRNTPEDAVARAGRNRQPGLEQVARIVAASPRASANLAFLGDKRFLFSESGTAFLMYGAIGRDWFSMGDPVGPETEAAELVWRLRELADRDGARAVFYEVGGRTLPRYLDLGYTLLNFGEEARVPLAGFSLDGSGRRDLRYTGRRFERDGCRFELVGPERRAGPDERAAPDFRRVARRALDAGEGLRHGLIPR